MDSLIVVDLEATCDPSPQDAALMETIEIGAVRLVPERWQRSDEFQTFVRPTVRPTLSAFCTELTSIAQADVDGAPYFAEAFGQFLDWVGDGPCVLASWGNYDVGQFARDCRRRGLAWPPTQFTGHLNVKVAFAKAYCTKRCGLGAAMQLAGESFVGRAHRGINDARAIATLLPLIAARDPDALALRSPHA